MKRLGWLLTLAFAAAAGALVLAPLAVQALVLVGGEWAPAWPLRVAALVVYESVLWGIGVGVWVVAQRLGWLTHLWHAVLVTLAAPLSETAVSLSLGRWPPGFSTVPGVVVRVLIAAVAQAAVTVLARRRSTAQVPGQAD